jgi:hypothetical protein
LDRVAWLDERITDSTQKEKDFHFFKEFAGNSGWFAFYIEYDLASGTRERRFIGIHNILDQSTVRVQADTSDPTYPFKCMFN